MDLERYLLFVGASLILNLVPGPDMLMILSRSIAQGRRAGLMAALGVNLGSYVHLVAAIVGISAVIASSAYAFTAIKWVGAIYLIYLGLRALFSKTGALRIANADFGDKSYRSIFWQGFWSDVLNPKVAIFYLALLPQFITSTEHHLPQLLLLGATANITGILVNGAVVLFSSAVTVRLRRDARISAWLAKALGVVFVAIGMRLAGTKAL